MGRESTSRDRLIASKVETSPILLFSGRDSKKHRKLQCILIVLSLLFSSYSAPIQRLSTYSAQDDLRP